MDLKHDQNGSEFCSDLEIEIAYPEEGNAPAPHTCDGPPPGPTKN